MSTPKPQPCHYEWLKQPFMRGHPEGQINAVYKKREEFPEKVGEFKQSLANGDVYIGPTITKQQARKLADMDIPVPDYVQVCSTRVGGKATDKD